MNSIPSLAKFALTMLVSASTYSLAATPDESLVDAVRNADESGARMALEGGANSNRPLPDGSTLIAWAIENQDRAIARLLLDHGAKLNGVGDASVQPLLIACRYGDPAMLEMLLAADAKVKVARPDGITSLSICAGTAPPAILERMIAAGAAIDKPDAHGQTPLMRAAAQGRVDNMHLLIARGAKVNRATKKGFTPLFFALKSNEPQAPIAILDSGGDAAYVAPDGTSVVQLAMYQKQYAFAARMIERGADLTAFDRNGRQLLHAAVLANQPSLVSLLLAKGADANTLTGSSQVEMRFEVNYKTGDYADPPKSPLLLAAEIGSPDIMRMLVAGEANARFRDVDGMNVVLAAAMSGKVAALEAALEMDSNANAINAHGQTALHLLLAAGTGSELAPMMKLLAAHGARIDIKSRDGKTPAEAAKDALTDAKAAFAATFDQRTMSQL